MNTYTTFEELWDHLTEDALHKMPSALHAAFKQEAFAVKRRVSEGYVITSPASFHARMERDFLSKQHASRASGAASGPRNQNKGIGDIVGGLEPGKSYRPMPKELVLTQEDQDREFWAEKRALFKEQIDELLDFWGIGKKKLDKHSTVRDIQDFCKYAERFNVAVKWVQWGFNFDKELLLKQTSADLDVRPLGNHQTIPFYFNAA